MAKMYVVQPSVFAFNEKDRAIVHREANRRQFVNEAKALKGRNNGAACGPEALRHHLLGAAGEMAAASYLGLKQFLYQETEARRGSYDLPPNIDVKTRSRHCYDLICQLDESPGKVLVLVTIESRITLVHGWIKSEDAMQEKWKKDPAKGRPAYFVPKENLSPIELLKECLNVQTLPNTPLA
jgi:hypothetical protein